MAADTRKPSDKPVGSSRMPENSMFYDRIIPAVLIILGVTTVAMILFALGILTGLIRWS